jgi:hypothetical protein
MYGKEKSRNSEEFTLLIGSERGKIREQPPGTIARQNN